MPPAVAAAAIVTGGALIGGIIQKKGAKKIARVQERGSIRAAEALERSTERGIAEQREARAAFETRTEPFLQLGLDARQRLLSFLDDPSQQLAEINPVVDFLRKQGFEQIQESAAARGRLGAGGTLKDLSRFDVGLLSTVVPQLQNQRFNQLFNVAGLGANVAVGQGTAGLQTSSNISNLLASLGRSQAGGILGQTQAQAGGILGQTQAITGGIENLTAIAGAFPNLFGQQRPSLPPPGAATPADIVSALGG